MSSDKISRSFLIDDDAFFIMSPSDGSRSPEERLLLAVLERAIRDLIGGGAEERADAERWLFGPEDDSEVRPAAELESLSFEWICDALNFNKEQLRERVLHAVEQSKSGTLPFFLDKRFLDRNREPEGRPQRGGRGRIRQYVDLAAAAS